MSLTKVKDLNQKIIQLVEALNIPYSQFADEISISRPILSHIITGRNKPSLEVIQKIITRFPELGYKWYLDNEEVPIHVLKNIVIERKQIESTKEEKSNEVDRLKTINSSTQPITTAIHTQVNTSEKQVQRILVFYSDNTFVEFVPKI
ncbi:MAG: helix-turn-helix domain-containing protein [Spirosomataceae bacterium]